MKRIVLAIFTLDVFFLNCILKLRRFCEEWLSWSTRWMERGLIVLYAVPGLVALGYFRSSTKHLETALFLVGTGSICVIAGMMWRQQKEPDSMRMMRLLSPVIIVSRIFLFVLAVWMLTLNLAAPPHHWYDIFFAQPTTAYVAFQYLTALPTGGNRRGRRRKLAAAKLREMFGSWLPVPEGNPA